MIRYCKAQPFYNVDCTSRETSAVQAVSSCFAKEISYTNFGDVK